MAKANTTTKTKPFELLACRVRESAEHEYPRIPTLRLRCLIVSYSLFTVARRAGFRCKLVGGWYIRNPFPAVPLRFGDPQSIAFRAYRQVRERHCWVEYSGHIWDVTRTQFGDFPKISILAKPNQFYISDHIDLDGALARKILPMVGAHGVEDAKRIIERVTAWESAREGAIKCHERGI